MMLRSLRDRRVENTSGTPGVAALNRGLMAVIPSILPIDAEAILGNAFLS